jgi:predicted metal-dependent phosphoesterase TrpH
MRLDTHVHTVYSGASPIPPLRRFLRECYNSPEAVYRRAKARGMDLVAITDHDEIDGALAIAHRPDVIVGCEVTGVFPRDGVRVHLGVLGLNEAQHREIQRRRHDIRDLMPYLHAERLFVSLNHVASRINGPISAAHIAALMPWVNGLEVINGSRLRSQNRTARRIADANVKVPVGGSDSHTGRGVGRTWVEAPNARTREEFLTELHAGRVRAGGRQGNGLTMASDIVRIASGFYEEQARECLGRPWAARRQTLTVAALTLGWPLVMVPVAIAMVHFGLEMRFNRGLLSDLAQRPELGILEPA